MSETAKTPQIPPSLPPAAQSTTAPLSPSRPAARKLRQPPPSRKRHRPIVNPSQPIITQFFSAISTPPPPALFTTTSNLEIALGPGASLDLHDWPYPNQASNPICNLMVNNTTVAPNGSTSRTDPDGTCWPMAGSEGHPEQTQCPEPDNLRHTR